MQDLTGKSLHDNANALKLNLFSKTNLLFIGALVLVTYAVFSPVLSFGFVDWDDPSYLLENPTLKGPFSLAMIGNIFRSGVNDNYSPLSILTFALEKLFFAPVPEEAPFIFHFDNLLLHVVNTVLVFVLFMKLGLRSPGAFIGALLFGIHPMRVESVAWVTERKDVLYGLFYLATLICYINYINGSARSRMWYIVAFVLALLSCTSKIQGVMLPLSMVAIDYYTRRKWTSPATLVTEKLPWWILSTVWGLGTIFFLAVGEHLNPVPEIADYSFIDKMAVGAYTYAVYLAKLVYPYKMTYYYDYPVHMPAVAYALILVLPLTITAFLVWAGRRKHYFLVFGWAFFTVNIFFMLQLLPVGEGFMADRFTYIAYTGLFFVIAGLYQLLATQRPNVLKIANGAFVLYFILFAFKTYSQAGVWKDTISLNEHYIRSHPENYFGYNQTGKHYFRQAFLLKDDERHAMFQKSKEYLIDAHIKDSINGVPVPLTHSDILQSIGVIYGLTGEKEQAIDYFTKAIALAPQSVEAYKNRAYQYFLYKDIDAAIADYSTAIQMEPGNSDLYYLRANCYYSKKDIAVAKKDLEQAIALGSTDPNCFIAMSVVYRAEGDVIQARAYAGKAKELGVNVPDVYFE